MKIGIIGCGLIGKKRVQTLGDCQFTACADLDFERAQALAKPYPACTAYKDWQTLLAKADVDAVVIATPHVSLAEITLAAIHHHKHVLVEKPAARHADELQQAIDAARQHNILVRVGFNHRYHRAMQKARQLIDEGALGELMFIRGRYGHGGRLGYDKEWRANPELSGGGELIDQGVHLIDLARWYLGDFTEVQGHAHTYYWDMAVDDNSFLTLKTAKKQTAFLHVSCTEWKNLFSLEIYGKQGKIHINGLGGSYGTESLAFYKMLPEMGPPETEIFEYPMADNSWQVEFAEFVKDIQKNRKPNPGLQDAFAALDIVKTIYKESGL